MSLRESSMGWAWAHLLLEGRLKLSQVRLLVERRACVLHRGKLALWRAGARRGPRLQGPAAASDVHMRR